MRLWGGTLPLALWIPTGLLALTAILVHHQRPASQLLARAVLWSNLGLGFLIATSGGSSERMVAAVLASCTGGALLLLGQKGLDGEGATSFAPLAYRTTIFSLFLLALADVQGLALFSGIMVENLRAERAFVPFGLGGLLVFALIGLYHLRVWGLALHVVANLALIASVATRVLDLPDPVLAALAVSATLQIALCLPLFAALARGRTRPDRGFSRAGKGVAAVVIACLVGVSLYATFFVRGPLIDW
jgi:hypothetical protein